MTFSPLILCKKTSHKIIAICPKADPARGCLTQSLSVVTIHEYHNSLSGQRYSPNIRINLSYGIIQIFL
ncbi:MAG: hypothetical protein K0R47_213 [Brevibacillus sp.]|nr:hypothetical protein [Brevibacillus sp.]